MLRALISRLQLVLAVVYVRLLYLTVRIEHVGRESLLEARRQAGAVVLSVWHSRLVMIPTIHRDADLTVLVSTHGDGRRLGRLFRTLGFDLAFGSSTRGGALGMREALRAASRGHAIGLAPDGPRGPRRVAKPGVVALARLSGLPILPVAFSSRPSRRLKSWDRMLIPFPFGRGVIVYGEAIHVPRHADAAEQARLLSLVDQALDRVTDEADRRMGVSPGKPACRQGEVR